MEHEFFEAALLNISAEGLWALAPYLWLCLGIVVCTLAAGFNCSTKVLRVLVWGTLAPFSVALMSRIDSSSQVLFGTSLEIDALTRVVGASIGVFACLSSLYSQSSDKRGHAEWAALLLISTLGLSLLPAARDWVAFFVFLETAALSGYVLAALDTERLRSLEAGLKYLMIGAFATGIFLLGLSFLYGLGGSFDFERIATNVGGSLSGDQRAYAIAAAILVFVSLGFKVALVPFHMWAADVYQGAPTGFAAFLATATKLSIFASLVVAFTKSGLFNIPGLNLFIHWVALASIVVGSLMALSQRKIRRMLAYSSVVNAGYVGLAIAAAGSGALGSIVTYLCLYGLALIAAFAVIEHFSLTLAKPPHEDLEIEDLAFVSERASGFSILLLTLALISLAGIPPLPGFLGKYLILKDLWTAADYRGSLVLVLGTLLGVAYYIRSLVPLYFGADFEKNSAKQSGLNWTLVSGVLATLVMLVILIGFARMNETAELLTKGLAR